MSFNKIEEILEDLSRGMMVIIVDDEDRENEGDLLMVASLVKPEDINFMAKFGRGLVCLTLTRERCKQLALPLMVDATNDRHGTNFTLSIEAAEGVTTGISAYDRAHTIRTAVAPNALPEDIVQPGHIFPIMAQPGGVLTRAGHTEAGCDLSRLAGFEPAAVIVEILNEDGTMARRPDLEKFAAEHQLKIGTIADLIKYRVENERTVERVAEATLPTTYGDFRLIAYKDSLGDPIHFALVKGEILRDEPVLVRVHLEDAIADTLPVDSTAFGWPLYDAMKRISEAGAGVAVVLRQHESNQTLVQRIQRLGGVDPHAHKQWSGEAEDLRTYGIGAQILADVGVRKMRLLSTPKKMHGLSGFGLEVTDYIWEDV